MTEEKKKVRGPGKKPALILTSIRLPKYVMEYFKLVHPNNRQVKMREALEIYVTTKLNQGESND